MAATASSSAEPPSPPPSKRIRLGNDNGDVQMLDAPSVTHQAPVLSPLPASLLLLHLPAILVHPPNHAMHAKSLSMSLISLRRCLQIPGLSPDIECRALTALAEIGMIVLDGGLSQLSEHAWAQGIEAEAKESTTRGAIIAEKHPSLRIYRSQLTFLAAQLAVWQHNIKFARMLLRRLLTTYLPIDPPHIVYTAHLKLISYLITPTATPSPSSSPVKSTQDVRQVTTAIQAMQDHASKHGHTAVVMLTRVLHLRQLVSFGLWEQASEALAEAEETLGIEFSPAKDVSAQQPLAQSPRKGLRVTDLNIAHMNAPSPTKLKSANSLKLQSSPASATGKAAVTSQPSFKMFHTYFERSMALHTLIIGVVFYTYVGRVSDATQRLSHLHALLDAGALCFESDMASSDGTQTELSETTADSTGEQNDAACGIVRISFSRFTPPLCVQTTHPRILYILAYLVSCAAKKDPVGRRPKRKIFAIEGLAAWERELQKELRSSSSSTSGDFDKIDLKLAKIKADLMCELVGVSIMRSEFDAAVQALSVLIAHLRNSDLFTAFSGRVSLHHAHLAHAKGLRDRAMECYKVAEAFAAELGDSFVRLSARAGQVCLKIGLNRDREFLRREDESRKNDTRRTRSKSRERKTANADAMDVDEVAPEPSEDVSAWDDDTQSIAESVVEECRGVGGTMWSVGRIIEACLTDEILKSKQHLKCAVSFASSAGDNHLRALILALIASHYFHTATDDALGMLGMCENLAAGLGATIKPPGVKRKEKTADAIGNAPLRTWVGERNLEIYKRIGNISAAKKQETANRGLQITIRKSQKRVSRAIDTAQV
ncbi:hypothetical protein D9757_002307 [Collybiopsis confluens]|uniref:Uncharacterized protein n=1 Tax=Collybiopsis confluens TaxID=2823264 RepID=A0A8H5MG29_9AGAR|nr:hypothetical protein D9757_002307 [Collybiopsis confluens]